MKAEILFWCLSTRGKQKMSSECLFGIINKEREKKKIKTQKLTFLYKNNITFSCLSWFDYFSLQFYNKFEFCFS